MLEPKLPSDWPSEGRITFDRYSTRYRQGLDLVLSDISLDVQPKEKVCYENNGFCEGGHEWTPRMGVFNGP